MATNTHKSLLCIFILSANAHAADVYPYAAVGIGYKIDEPNSVNYNGEELDMDFGSNDTALMEAGFEIDGGYSFGIKHDSQWSTGWPVNDKEEYRKTEVFVRYKFGGIK